ncbi:MAG TPA: 2-C-methyl-D-erythritol 4-phosphate cytidylyltransferase [Gammaproteobacteria bacterium]|jgi:2-C-methyl-D-erythritol 4-phosphate cytidylyltransferase|nr:2-C-methyl-D-erythritol 4-phosphate cytidylyltransferase [Gammaproteobacteria bacterium]MDP6731945.1 2-C-methyl-D-erythritol 4-phosphate cytidylyltransferase [Gammaproteobacteria bacterium]HAJ74831.1 2-C-methyl-D-erythritol 4-phosphate cytidylyltransferase [Gammaproteobacteria bacterium]|tara:strand:- start:3263 stop:3970 length:708 start_codon:yes stop_codon:yes gene_type:complete
MTTWAILPAAGIGRRMGSNTPKQYLPLDGIPVIVRTLQRLLAVAAIDKIVVVLHPQDDHWKTLDIPGGERMACTEGGQARYQSVLNGLRALSGAAQESDWVLVHDAVRPCVPVADIEKLIATLQSHDVGGLLATPVDNTLKQAGQDLVVSSTVDRNLYFNALTPQMFRYGLLLAAMERVERDKLAITDEAAAMESMGLRPQLVQGSKMNIKITHDADLALAAAILSQQANSLEVN